MRALGSRLAVRLALVFFAVIAVTTATMALYVAPILERRVVESLREGLLTSARLVEEALRPAIDQAPWPPAGLPDLVDRYARTVGARLSVIAADGRVLADSAHDPGTMENHATRPEVAAALAGGPGSDVRRSRTLEVPMLYVAVPLEGPDRPRAVIRLAMPLTAVSHAAGEVRRTVLAGAAAALALSLGFAILVTRRVVRPITRMRAVARRMAQGDLAQQVRVRGADEIAELGEALNQMAAALRTKVTALEAERAEVAAILDGIVEGVIALDHRGRMLLLNPAARRILEVPPDDPVAGRPLLEVVRQKALADVVEGARRAAPGAPSSHEIELGPPIGRVLRAHAAAVPLAGPEAGTVLVLHDVTELRRLERIRAEFVANVSHELRTPLTAIRGYLETLLEEGDEDRAHARRFLEIAHAHAGRLGRLVDDLLQLSDVESGRAVLVPTRVALREAAALVAATFDREVTRKRLALENRVPPDVAVRADPDRVSQILVNLVDNAVKYTPAGGRVTVGAERRDRWVETAVSDTGIGIPARDLPRLSERFYRVDKARSRELGGTGLGLAIVKHLVQAHGGELAIESEPGSGTTVRFTLPAA